MNPNDGGIWRCNVKEELRSNQDFFEAIEVTVAIPYVLELEPEEPLILRGKVNESTSELICSATGAGGIDPIIKWQVNGEFLESSSIWRDFHSEGYNIIYTSLELLEEDLEDGTIVRCLSKQYYPNNTVIFESSIASTITVVEGIDITQLKSF